MTHQDTFLTLYQTILSNVKPDIQTIFPHFFVRHNYFKNSFFPSAITEWNKLDCLVQNADLIRPLPNSIFNIHNALGIKYLTRLRIGFSHLKEHKFRHNFQDSVDLMCSCSSGTETTKHFLLHCPNFHL